PLVRALRRGSPIEFLLAEMETRRRHAYPPFSEVMVVEARSPSEGIDADLRRLPGESVSVMGPADTHQGRRWLIQGRLGGYKLAMRPLVQRWRDSGATVRIDADPLDL
ncbi:MAG TPA: hypothetical protein VE173_08065, partial [Longimicrobiales bacterium]|nr:hypothetical protein [Longimicrobiales bacterium]